MEPSEVTAFVSWAHTTAEWTDEQRDAWRTTVLTFTDLLRSEGVSANLDLYHQHDPAVDWSRFGPEQIDRAEFVIVAVSRAWIRRFDGSEAPTVGPGACREADALLSIYHKDRNAFGRKVKLVYLPGADTSDVPDTLHGVQRFGVSRLDADGVEDLLRTLHGRPRYQAPPVGRRPALPPYRRATQSPGASSGRGSETIGLSSNFIDPPQGPMPGWVTEPLLRLRVACCITPATSGDTDALKPRVRQALIAALDSLELTASIRTLSSRLTPLTALPSGEHTPRPVPSKGWRLNTEAHLSTAHAMFQLGGDGASGAVANVAVNLPAAPYSEQATVWIDIGLSFQERIALFDLARLLMHSLRALPALRVELAGVLPEAAALATTGITISAPQNVGASFRENGMEQRIDFSTVGAFNRRIRGDIGGSLRLPDRYGATHAAEVTYLALERILTDAGAVDPDEGLSLLRRHLHEASNLE